MGKDGLRWPPFQCKLCSLPATVRATEASRHPSLATRYAPVGDRGNLFCHGSAQAVSR
jgi:hypothetical protein